MKKQAKRAVRAIRSLRLADQLPERARRINQLGQLIGFQSYLEIGVAFGETFFRVHCPRKVAVDPTFGFDPQTRARRDETYWALTSDEYFAGPGANESFDLVFLDGLHTYEQTLRDFQETMARTTPRSIIVIDDTVPSDPFSAIPDQTMAYYYRARFGRNPRNKYWHGDVFKLVVYIHDQEPELSYRTFHERGNAQTVVWRETRNDIRPHCPDARSVETLDFFWLFEHRRVLNLATESDILTRVAARFGGTLAPGATRRRG